jgi:hypothetical protein
MKEMASKAWAGFKSTFVTARVSSPLGERLQAQDTDEPRSPRPTAEEARKSFRTALTDCVAGGWTLEIENEYDAVLSKKAPFHWGGKLIVFLILLFIFAPLALFYLIVVIVRGVSAKPSRLRVWIDEDGLIQQRDQY